MKKKNGFTLLELLVVVLIIGILAAIALPQYKKAVLKSKLHIGVSLVESLYQAQQSYALVNGDFATNIDALDVEIPKNDSCTKTDVANYRSGYSCHFGVINLNDRFSNIHFAVPNYQIAYIRYVKDFPFSYIPAKKFERSKRYCFANLQNNIAQKVCVEMGGVYLGEDSYKYYELQ